MRAYYTYYKAYNELWRRRQGKPIRDFPDLNSVQLRALAYPPRPDVQQDFLKDFLKRRR